MVGSTFSEGRSWAFTPLLCQYVLFVTDGTFCCHLSIIAYEIIDFIKYSMRVHMKGELNEKPATYRHTAGNSKT